MHWDPCWQNVRWTHGLGRCTQNRKGGIIQIFIKNSSCVSYSASDISASVQIAFNSLGSLDTWVFGWVIDEFPGSVLYLGSSFDHNVIGQNASRR